MTTLEFAYPQIEKLVHKFKALSAAERKNMNENATRQGYILPLFSTLGWDTTDIHQVSPEEKVSRGWAGCRRRWMSCAGCRMSRRRS
jgi:hypothetical protein